MKNFMMDKKALQPVIKPKKVEQKSIVPERYYRVPLDKKIVVAVPKIEKEQL